MHFGEKIWFYGFNQGKVPWGLGAGAYAVPPAAIFYIFLLPNFIKNKTIKPYSMPLPPEDQRLMAYGFVYGFYGFSLAYLAYLGRFVK